MRKYISLSAVIAPPRPRIFKIAVREDANEVGMVVAYPIPGYPEEANIQGQIKIFSNESAKLQFLANARKQGFRNFETVKGKVDIEKLVLSELARRQKLERKKEEEEKKKTEKVMVA